LPQCHQGFPQGHGGDAELAGEIGLAGQLLAVGEQSEVDGVTEPPHDGIHAGQGVDGREDDSAGAGSVSIHEHHLAS
jgi:hypothetical protein